MNTTPPIEADWNKAPALIEGAMNLTLTPEQCGLGYWISSVAQGTWMGLENGHTFDLQVPDYMLQAGPLRSAIIEEFAFRSIGEELATRALGYLVAIAPTITTMEFYATQLLDEARHAWAFRRHLVDLGVPIAELADAIECVAGRGRDTILRPLESFGLRVIRDEKDFIGGVVIITILVEGVLAPAAELSELKWRLLDPPAASIERGANIDEIRHLTVGSSIVRRHIIEHPSEKQRIVDLIATGRRIWADLPTHSMLLNRETLFQRGMMAHATRLASYQLRAGLRLIDTTPLDRVSLANEWTSEMQTGRLSYMGLADAC